MKKSIFVPLLLAIIALMFGIQPAASEEIAMNIMRPKPPGEQAGAYYTEINYLLLDARHPDGIEWMDFYQRTSKQGGPALLRHFTAADRHESGYFFHKRRFKSPQTMDHFFVMKPVGGNAITSTVQAVKYVSSIRDYLGFCNMNDGDVVEANNSSDSNDLTYIYLDCMDSSGFVGSGTFQQAHVGYKDEDGIDFVELVINGPDGELVVTNDAALIFDSDQIYHGRYWADLANTNYPWVSNTNYYPKAPEASWYDEPYNLTADDLYPIEGFGLYEFKVPLAAGSYTLTIRAKNNDGELLQGPSVSITSALDRNDIDADGIDDSWENTYFPSIDTIDGTADSDGDGVVDYFEYLYGSNPTNAASSGFCLAASMHSDGASVACDWSVREGFVLGQHYGVDISSNLIFWDALPGQYDLNESTNSGMTKLEVILPNEYGPNAFFKFSKP